MDKDYSVFLVYFCRSIKNSMYLDGQCCADDTETNLEQDQTEKAETLERK